jgi:predicted restriction endonuclease
LKLLYNNRCQICGNTVEENNWKYSEGHHIKPYGKNNGPDTLDNIIIVCPNCHAKLDFGIIKINIHNIRIVKHIINKKYIDYHNKEIYNKGKQNST